MARLNATPAKRADARNLTRLSEKKEPHTSIRRLFGQRFPTTAAADSDRQEQWTTTKEASTKQRLYERAERRPALERRGSQRSGKAPIARFDILPDSDGLSDVDQQYEALPQLSRGDRDKPKVSEPLKLAHVNSLLLPLSQQPRNRPAQKLETFDYAKENDPVDEVEEDTTPSISRNSSNASTRQSPVRRNARQDRGKDDDSQKFLKYRQTQETVSEDDGNYDDSLGSLEDFIVSDDEELSYQATSEEESEEEIQKVVSPPRPRRRLMRGRRPNLEMQVEEALTASYHEEFHLEPSLPAAMTVPATKLQVKSKRRSQKDSEIPIDIHNLTLQDNDLVDQPRKDFHEPPEGSTAAEMKSEEIGVNLETPPVSSSKSLLRSPTKGKIHIPPTPYRESVDAFWRQDIINDWVDQYSPRKEGGSLEQVLREFDDSDTDTSGVTNLDDMRKPRKREGEPKPPSKTALKRAEVEKKKASLARKKSFDEKKAQIASEFLKVLDDTVSEGQVQKLAEETGGVRIIWSKSLLTTAGRAVWKRERVEKKTRTSDGGCESTPSTKQHATIELAERIIDSEHRLLNTLAHEYCHLANYMISNVHNNPHGASFKQWGRRCKEALKDHPVYSGQVEVTTKHSYQIDYKYVWSCVDCGQNYGRHSKSIDTTKSRCGKCKGLLQQIKPKPRNVSPRKKPLQSSERFDKKTVEDVRGILGEVSLYS